MGVLIYIFRGLALVWFCISPRYRAKTRERWKNTPSHRLIYEIGGGILGLAVLGAIVLVVIVSNRK